MNKRNPGKNI